MHVIANSGHQNSFLVYQCHCLLEIKRLPLSTDPNRRASCCPRSGSDPASLCIRCCHLNHRCYQVILDVCSSEQELLEFAFRSTLCIDYALPFQRVAKIDLSSKPTQLLVFFVSSLDESKHILSLHLCKSRTGMFRGQRVLNIKAKSVSSSFSNMSEVHRFYGE